MKSQPKIQLASIYPCSSSFFFAGANFTGADNPFYVSPESSISPKAALILQNYLGDGSWVFVTNIIYNFIATDDPSLSYVITLPKELAQNDRPL
jgi:hypothetical protein